MNVSFSSANSALRSNPVLFQRRAIKEPCRHVSGDIVSFTGKPEDEKKSNKNVIMEFINKLQEQKKDSPEKHNREYLESAIKNLNDLTNLNLKDEDLKPIVDFIDENKEKIVIGAGAAGLSSITGLTGMVIKNNMGNKKEDIPIPDDIPDDLPVDIDEVDEETRNKFPYSDMARKKAINELNNEINELEKRYGEYKESERKKIEARIEEERINEIAKQKIREANRKKENQRIMNFLESPIGVGNQTGRSLLNTLHRLMHNKEFGENDYEFYPKHLKKIFNLSEEENENMLKAILKAREAGCLINQTGGSDDDAFSTYFPDCYSFAIDPDVFPEDEELLKINTEKAQAEKSIKDEDAVKFLNDPIGVGNETGKDLLKYLSKVGTFDDRHIGTKLPEKQKENLLKAIHRANDNGCLTKHSEIYETETYTGDKKYHLYYVNPKGQSLLAGIKETPKEPDFFDKLKSLFKNPNIYE